MDLRCGSTLHGVLDEEVYELTVKCKRRKCGAESGVVIVYHTFSLRTGELVRTDRFADPRKQVEDGAGHFASVRSP